jgi:hypothetical protein
MVSRNFPANLKYPNMSEKPWKVYPYTRTGRDQKAGSVLAADRDVFRTHETSPFVEEPVVQVQLQAGPGV